MSCRLARERPVVVVAGAEDPARQRLEPLNCDHPGSPPRGRGTLFNDLRLSHRRRVIPARAGNALPIVRRLAAPLSDAHLLPTVFDSEPLCSAPSPYRCLGCKRNRLEPVAVYRRAAVISHGCEVVALVGRYGPSHHCIAVLNGLFHVSPYLLANAPGAVPHMERRRVLPAATQPACRRSETPSGPPHESSASRRYRKPTTVDSRHAGIRWKDQVRQPESSLPRVFAGRQ